MAGGMSGCAGLRTPDFRSLSGARLLRRPSLPSLAFPLMTSLTAFTEHRRLFSCTFRLGTSFFSRARNLLCQTHVQQVKGVSTSKLRAATLTNSRRRGGEFIGVAPLRAESLREGQLDLFSRATQRAGPGTYLTTASRQWIFRAGKIQAKCFS